MKRYVLIILLCFVGALPLRAQGLQSKATFVVSENNGHTLVFENLVSDFLIDTSMGYFRINVSDCYSVPMHNVGCPSLPVVQKILSVPVGSRVEVEILTDEVEHHSLAVEQKLYPVQPSQSKSSEVAPWQFNHEVYTTDSYYSKPLVEVSVMGIMRGVQLVRLCISPFEYNPVRNTLKVHTLVSARVKTSVGASSGVCLGSPLVLSTHSSQLLTKAYYNDLQYGGDVPLKYVVVARDSFREALQPFINWKTQQGFEMVEYYPPYGYNRDSIRSYLSALYTSGTPLSPAPTFLLIVGDVEHIQSFIGRYKLPGGATHATDLYYAEYTGDIYPDVLYGRISVANVGELEAVVSKTIEYEQYNMPDKANLDKALLVAGRETREPAPTVVNGQMNYLKTELVEWFGMDTACFYNPTSYNSKDDIVSHLSANPGFISYSGHCTAAGWMYPNIGKSELDTFSQRGNYSFWVNTCCKSSNYTIGMCFGEALLRKPNAGAVGVVGAANETLWNEDYYWTMGAKYPFSLWPEYNRFALGAFDRLFHARELNLEDYVVNVAQMVQAGNMAVAESGSPYENYYWEIYNVLGDPSLMPYIGSPQPITLTLDDTVHVGDVIVGCSGTPLSRVAIMQDTVLLGTTMLDENGRGTLRLVRPITNAEVVLTTTAQYHIPLIDTIYVMPNSGARVVLTDYSFRDTLGNVIATVQPNQVVCLYGRLHNVGSSVAYGITFDMDNAVGVDSVWQDIVLDSLMSDAVYEGVLSLFVVSGHCRDNDVLSFESVVHHSDDEFRNRAGIMVLASAVEQLAVMFTDMESTNAATTLHNGSTYKVEVPIVNRGRSVSDSVQVLLEVNDVAVVQSVAGVQLAPLFVGDTAKAVFIIKLNSYSDSSLRLRIGVEERGIYNETTTYYSIGRALETFESGNFTFLQWDTTAVYPWYIDTVEANAHSGKYSARSDKIRGRQLSVLSLPLHTIVDDTISFWVKTSSEGSYDYLYFIIDGEKVGQWSGMKQWMHCKFALPRGIHMLTWQYEKDDETSSGQDAVWIDDLELPLAQHFHPILQPDSVVGITPIAEKYDIRIYPNPAKDYIFLETDNNTSTQVFIYNIQGVLSDSFEFDTAVYRYSIANYLAGVYTLMMINDGNIAVKKLLIIK